MADGTKTYSGPGIHNWGAYCCTIFKNRIGRSAKNNDVLEHKGKLYQCTWHSSVEAVDGVPTQVWKAYWKGVTDIAPTPPLPGHVDTYVPSTQPRPDALTVEDARTLLESKTVPVLKAACKAREMAFNANVRKAELIEMLLDAGLANGKIQQPAAEEEQAEEEQADIFDA